MHCLGDSKLSSGLGMLYEQTGGDLHERYFELVNTQLGIVNNVESPSVAKTMIGRQGFEPWTPGLKVRCSDQTELTAQALECRGDGRPMLLPDSTNLQ